MAFTFSKKVWESNRPRSAHGSGVVKAMKLVTTDCPAKPESIKKTDAFTKALAAVDALTKAFDTANGKIKPKDDKKGVLKMIKTWKGELATYRGKVETAQSTYGIAEGTKAANALYEKMLVELNLALAACKKTLAAVKKDVSANKKLNVADLAKEQQTYRTTIRDCVKFCTKAGKVDKIKFDGTIRALGVDPAAIPLPPHAKLVKKRVPLLEASVNELTKLIDDAVDAVPIDDSSKYAKPVKTLLGKYKTVRATHKRQASQAKGLAAAAKKLATVTKGGKLTDTSPLVTRLGKVMDIYLSVDGASLELQYSTRNRAGKIQSEYAKLVANKDFPKDLNDRIREQRASVFDAYKTVSTPLSQAKHQIGRIAKILLEEGGTTASQVDPLVKGFDSKVKSLSSKFGRATA